MRFLIVGLAVLLASCAVPTGPVQRAVPHRSNDAAPCSGYNVTSGQCDVPPDTATTQCSGYNVTSGQCDGPAVVIDTLVPAVVQP